MNTYLAVRAVIGGVPIVLAGDTSSDLPDPMYVAAVTGIDLDINRFLRELLRPLGAPFPDWLPQARLDALYVTYRKKTGWLSLSARTGRFELFFLRQLTPGAGGEKFYAFGMRSTTRINFGALPLLEHYAELDAVGVQNLGLVYASGDASYEIPSIQETNELAPSPPLTLSKGFSAWAALALKPGQIKMLAFATSGQDNQPGTQPQGAPAVTAVTPAPTGAQAGPPAPASSSGMHDGAYWLAVDYQAGPLYLASIGVGFKQDDKQDSKLTLQLTGGLRLSVFQLELIGAGVALSLKNPWPPEFLLNGLALSFKAGPVSMSGIFIRRTAQAVDAQGQPVTYTQYAGEVRIEMQSFSILAVGAYGKLNSGATTLFIYGALTAGQGGGIGNSMIRITGLALGFGVNYRVNIPDIKDVASFSLVKMVMGDGNPQSDPAAGGGAVAPSNPPSPAPTTPGALLEVMLEKDLAAQEGQYFGALGLRFTLFETIDCFALAIVQGGQELEIALVGLGRFRKPATGRALAYVELEFKVDIKPAAGLISAEAQLTASSWVLDPACHLAGGFALLIWYDGPHSGDFVLSLGGYHPRFVPPSYYPVVPRLSFNWQVSSELSIKGESYFALTPSSIMFGGRLEASFNSGAISASFLAYLDALVQWKPLYYEITAGIAIHVSADLGFFSVDLTLSVDLAIQGPPFHGTARFHVGPVSGTIVFGDDPDVVGDRIGCWPEFGRSFLDRVYSGACGDGKQEDETCGDETGKWTLPTEDSPVVNGPTIARLSLVRGRIEQTRVTDPATAEKADWRVRADQLEFAVKSAIPATGLAWGAISVENGQAVGLVSQEYMGQPLSVFTPVVVDVEADDEDPEKKTRMDGTPIGVRPMAITALTSTLNVTVVRIVGPNDDPCLMKVPLGKWIVQADKSPMPSAVWGQSALDRENPSVDHAVIADCVTGLASFRPPAGGPRGGQVGPIQSDDLGWDPVDPVKKLDPAVEMQTDPVTHLVTVAETQTAPSPLSTRPDVGAEANASSQRRQRIQAALVAMGFDEAAGFQVGDGARFRALQAAPLGAGDWPATVARRQEKSA